jgi:(p)ppGpp synthase/HD superfamily hydrolase
LRPVGKPTYHYCEGETENHAKLHENFERDWHASQRRKGTAKEPYVNHLLEVASLVASAGASEGVICAAFLHDAIEDQSF